MNDKDYFVQKLTEKLEAHGIETKIERLEELEDFFTIAMSVSLRKDGYGWGFEYKVSRAISQGFSNAEPLAYEFYRQFHYNLENHLSMEAYNALSNEAKATFAVLCLESYLSLSIGERKLATELYESGLVDGYSIPTHDMSYELRPTSQAMRVYARLKGHKP